MLKASSTHPETIFTCEELPSCELSENQKKVIHDKYLKGSKSVEQWLAGVARNIALAELLTQPANYQWGLFDGVRVYKTNADRTLLFHHGLSSADERDKNIQRFIQNCNAAVNKFPEARAIVEAWANRFYNLMSTWTFLPNSPTLMNAGNELQQLSACYVLPVEDSIESITNALQSQALIHKSGGGTGFSFEKLRPAGSPVKSTSGVASGVVSFMKVFDRMTDVVKQGGNRRGANMGILPYWHPEIKDFIRLKSRPGIMENFNVSVAVDNLFFEAVENNWDYDLKNPRTGEPVERVSARDIFNGIVDNAWKSGDPGLIFIDRINNSSSNPTPALGRISATNPCGEQPLLPNEPCNLGSLNLSNFVISSTDDCSRTDRQVNWTALKEAVHLSIRFLDDVIDVNNYPLPDIEIMAKGNRRIGLGVMGWAEMLVKLGIPYDSDEAIVYAKEIMSFINKEALRASEELAREKNRFPNWKNSVFDPASPHYRGDPVIPRHCARTTIAPTGTIALAAGLQGTGIEPFYGIAYTRYNAKALDALKNDTEPNPDDVYFEINPLFLAIAEDHQFFGLEKESLLKKIEANKKSIRGISEIPEWIQKLFPVAHDVSVDMHVRMQAAFQEFTDNAVSKTINLPHNASADDVRTAYLLAYQLGCKGITIYRDASKQQQVLNLVPNEKRVRTARDLRLGVSSESYEIKTGYGLLNVHIDFDGDGPFRLFSNLEAAGTEMAGLTSTVGLMISKFLDEGGNPNALLRNLGSVKGDRPTGLGVNKINSISHGIAVALRTHLEKHHWLDESESSENLELWNLSQAQDKCPRCLSSNVHMNSGCSGPACQDCGYSECS